DDAVLCPVPVVLGRRRSDEPAMTAVRADVDVDARVARHLRVAERPWRNERIVFGGDNERRNADPFDDVHRARPMVVVVGAGEPEVRRGVDLVEFAYRPDAPEPAHVEPSWPAPVLPPHPALQVLHEIPLIETVARPFQRADALADR